MNEKINYYIEYIDYLIDCEQFDKAIKNIDNLNDQDKDMICFSFKKAFCFYKLESYQEAINLFNKCAIFKEKEYICKIFIGLCYLKMNNFENGINKIEEQLLKEEIKIKQKEINNHYQEKIITDIDQDLFCCPLTLEIYKDPYITPNGNTFEHAALIQHLNEVGNFDPLTREYLDENMIIPNRKIKELIEKN
jgi:tetratricopeptide (TPR) repeat protein